MAGFHTHLDQCGYAPATRRTYQRNLAQFQDWLTERHKTLARATWKDIQDFSKTLRFTYYTRSAFRSSLACYYKWRKVSDPPLWAVEQPRKPRGHYRGLRTKEHAHQLLEAARRLGPEPYAACCGLYYQALRREECSRVKWADLKDGRIRGIGKGMDEFDRPLHPQFVLALQELTPDGPYVFAGRWPGTHVSPATIWMWVRLAAERAGLGRVTPHQLRHTSIALYQHAAGLRAAAEHARHRNINQTLMYSFTSVETEEEGMAAL